MCMNEVKIPRRVLGDGGGGIRPKSADRRLLRSARRPARRLLAATLKNAQGVTEQVTEQATEQPPWRRRRRAGGHVRHLGGLLRFQNAPRPGVFTECSSGPRCQTTLLVLAFSQNVPRARVGSQNAPRAGCRAQGGSQDQAGRAAPPCEAGLRDWGHGCTGHRTAGSDPAATCARRRCRHGVWVGGTRLLRHTTAAHHRAGA